MSQERDTHFVNAARLLVEQMYAVHEEELETLIAQFAYDLLVHDRMHTGTSDLQHAASTLEAEEMVNGVPDMTAWPEYSE